jgi:hypothetical protein
MNSDDFEQRLQRQPLRQVPAAWRTEILREGRRVAVPNFRDASMASLPVQLLSTLNAQLKTLLWPNPLAWGGLAAVWALILALNVFTSDKPQATARQTAPPSPEMITALKEQRRELAQLVGLDVPMVVAEPKSFLPRPRSERREGIMLT